MAGPKRRITIVGLHYAPETTGNAPYTASLAQRLQQRGHEVTVITGYPHYPEWKIRDGYAGWRMSEFVEGVRVERLRHPVPAAPTHLTRMLMELTFGGQLLFARWGQPDMVLFVSPALFSTVIGVIRRKLAWRRVPTAVWVQDLYSRGVEETASRGRSAAGPIAMVESWLLNSVNRVVAIHGSFAQYITGALRVPRDRVAVIRNWTHLPAASKPETAHVRAKLGWAREDIIVLHAGNMGVKQGLDNVVNAARLAGEKKSRVRFILLGDGNQNLKLRALGQGLSNLSFLAPVPDTEFQSVLAAADILLVNELPGVRGMSVPSKLTSYFSTGRPVIAATDEDSVTAREIAASQGGVLVPAGNPDALLVAAEELGHDSERSRSLGAAGLRFREHALDEMLAISAFEELLDVLLKEADPASLPAAGLTSRAEEDNHARQ